MVLEMKPDTTFDPRLAAKKLLREARSGALATLMPDSGDPYCSLVNVATTIGGSPVLLLHGTGDAAGIFLPLLNELHGVRSIAPDLPGRWLSARIDLP